MTVMILVMTSRLLAKRTKLAPRHPSSAKPFIRHRDQTTHQPSRVKNVVDDLLLAVVRRRKREQAEVVKTVEEEILLPYLRRRQNRGNSAPEIRQLPRHPAPLPPQAKEEAPQLA